MAETQSTSSIHITQVPVRWGDFDRFGHITNAAYVELAQEARMAFAMEEFVGRGMELPSVFVRKIEADYLRPILPTNVYVTVETQVVEIGNTSFTTRQEIKDSEGQICCVVEVVQVAIDIMTARPRSITTKEIKVLTRAAD
ncbi:MAG: acyl-CoA thioesterase [Corynebacterium sp.]|nr:acyl-CoA thioesterase [Corynebacterium sp.]